MKAVNVDEVLNIMRKYGEYIWLTDNKKYSDMVDEIANLKSIKLTAGNWLPKLDGKFIYAKCSECGKVQNVASNYCPNCGCLMDRNDFNAYINTESEKI